MGRTKKIKNTKQQLEYVEDEKKLHVKQIKCMNSRQKEFLNSINSSEISICVGPAGCGKTYLALWQGLKYLEKNQFDGITLVKSVTPLPGEDVGFLPGEINQKLDPFIVSYTGNIDKLIGEPMRKKLLTEGKIKVQPLAYIRGINIDNQFVILDECQNLTMPVFKSIITRIGKNSKYVIMGDVDQIDLKNRKTSILQKALNIFKDDEKIGTVEFTAEDCVRNPIIPHVLDKLKEIE